MHTLTIKDLSRNEALDGKAMSAVRGGMAKYALPVWFGAYDLSSHDSSVKAQQSIGQNQEVFNANGNNVALAGDIHSKVKPTQTATNNVFA